MISLRSVLAAAIGIAIAGGCSSNKPPAHCMTTAPATRISSTRPIVDFGHGAAGFPLVGKVPIDSSQHLQEELTAGYAARVKMPTTKPVVMVDGELPQMKSLIIDLSGGEIRTAYRPTSLKGVDSRKIIGHVDELKYIADPLSYSGASQHLVITASDVTLGLLRGRGEKEVLVMSDAGSGEAKFDATLNDLNLLLKAAAREHAGSTGYFATNTYLKLSSDNPHALSASLRVEGFFLFIPTTFTISGRVDIDPGFYATMSELSCKGNDVGGALLAGFINERLQKYEGLRQPLTAFPGEKMRMRNLLISVDDSLHVEAEFGR